MAAIWRNVFDQSAWRGDHSRDTIKAIGTTGQWSARYVDNMLDAMSEVRSRHEFLPSLDIDHIRTTS